MKKFTYLLVAALSLFGGALRADVNSTRELLQSYSANHPKVTETYDRLITEWESCHRQTPNWDLFRLLTAVEFAAQKHAGQVRKDAEMTPYIIHPLGVTALLWETGKVRSVNVLVAGLLHDTLEDTDATEGEIESLFGPRVLYTIKELTNDPTLEGDAIKEWQVQHAPTMSLDAQLVKLADRVYNVTDLSTSPPPSWPQEKIDSYRSWGRKLLDALRGANPPLEETLEALTQP